MNPKGKKFLIYCALALAAVAGILGITLKIFIPETFPVTTKYAPEILTNAIAPISGQIIGILLLMGATSIPIIKTLQRKRIGPEEKKGITFLAGTGAACFIMGHMMLQTPKENEEAIRLWEMGGIPVSLYLTNPENPDEGNAYIQIHSGNQSQIPKTIILPNKIAEKLFKTLVPQSLTGEEKPPK